MADGLLNYTIEDGFVQLRVIDRVSGQVCVTIRLPAREFLMAVGGSQPACQFEIAAEQIGLMPVRDTRQVHFRTFGVTVTTADVETVLKPHEVDGWRAEVGDRSWADVQRLCQFVDYDGDCTILSVPFVRFERPEAHPTRHTSASMETQSTTTR